MISRTENISKSWFKTISLTIPLNLLKAEKLTNVINENVTIILSVNHHYEQNSIDQRKYATKKIKNYVLFWYIKWFSVLTLKL